MLRTVARLGRNVRVLRILAQLVFLGVVVGLVGYLAGNLNRNLRRQGIPTGFDYLNNRAGFRILDSTFEPTQSVLDAVFVGVRNTATVAIVGIVLALIIGIVVGVARLSRNWLVRKSAAFYVEALRNIPVLVLIIFVNQAVILQLPRIQDAGEILGVVVVSNSGISVPWPRGSADLTGFTVALAAGALAAFGLAFWRTRKFDATGTPHHRVAWATALFLAVGITAFFAFGRPFAISFPEVERFRILGGFRLSPQYTALLLGLVLYTASHIAEIVRGSIQAVPAGQSEAATALGLSEFARLRFVVLPQAFRIMIPPVANQFLNLTKNSSLAVAVGYPEVTRLTQILIGNGQPPLQSIAVLMLVYLSFSLVISAVTNLVNRRLQLVTR